MSESTNAILKRMSGDGGALVIPMTYSAEYTEGSEAYVCTVTIDATYDDIKNAIAGGKLIIFTMDINDGDHAGVSEIIPIEVSANHYYKGSESEQAFSEPEYYVGITMFDISVYIDTHAPFPFRSYMFVQNTNQKMEATFIAGMR